MPPLGGRRPSELLAEMLQLCPRDDMDGRIIRYMFLFQLTPTMQSMLGEDKEKQNFMVVINFYRKFVPA